jgi:hypothetical protein
MKPGAIRVVETEVFFESARQRGAFEFGGSIAGELTFCHICARVENRRGLQVDGRGASVNAFAAGGERSTAPCNGVRARSSGASRRVSRQ